MEKTKPIVEGSLFGIGVLLISSGVNVVSDNFKVGALFLGCGLFIVALREISKYFNKTS